LKIFPKKSKRKNSSTPKVVVVLGPNASGKSHLGVELARRFNGEIISADSRQVYRGLDIGSGKVTTEEMGGIPHHMIDVASPKEVFTVAQYQTEAKSALSGILDRRRLPIIVGGTGLYIDALIYDIKFPKVPPNQSIRSSLEPKGTEELFDELKALDPKRASDIDKHNRRRIVRSLEIIRQTGERVPRVDRKTKYDVLKIGLKLLSDELRERIKRRLEERLDNGMIEEVRRLNKTGLEWKRMDELGLEYRYVARYLRDTLTMDELKEKILTEDWKYARRQMTWFRRDKEIIWIDSPEKAFPIVRDFLSL